MLKIVCQAKSLIVWQGGQVCQKQKRFQQLWVPGVWYNYYCSQVVNTQLRTCTILIIFSCFRNTTDMIVANKK